MTGHVATTDGHDLVIGDVEVEGRARRTVLVRGGRIVDIAGPGAAVRSRHGADVVDGHGGALLPGLNDHHLHLFSTVAYARSVRCDPVAAPNRAALADLLRRAARDVRPGEWVRAVGYDETRLGMLTGRDLDALLGPWNDRAVRVQHRSGHAWIVNSVASARLGITAADGVILDADRLLRETVGGRFGDLRELSRGLARVGVTGVTDAGPDNDMAVWRELARQSLDGALLQRCLVMGGQDLDAVVEAEPRLCRGPVKVMLVEHDLPGLDELVHTITAAGSRGVAIHAVTRESLVLAAVALVSAGVAGQRVEHASVASDEVITLLTTAGAIVVTQPGFIQAHGDRYRSSVDADDQPLLYRLAAWLRAGIPLAAGSDAPFGPIDPWFAMRAAVARRTADGAELGLAERLTPEEALTLFTAPLDEPGHGRTSLRIGDRADLVLLERPWREARQILSADLVRLTVIDGRPVSASPARH